MKQAFSFNISNKSKKINLSLPRNEIFNEEFEKDSKTNIDLINSNINFEYKQSEAFYKEHPEVAIRIGLKRKGKKLSEETRRKISNNHPDFSNEKNPYYGKSHSEESRNKMKESARKRDKSTYNTFEMQKHLKGNKNASNSRWMTNGEISIKVNKLKVNEYLKNGWRIGRTLNKYQMK